MSKYNKKNNESSDESSSESEEEVIAKKQVKKQTKYSNNSDSSNDKKSAKKMSSSDSGSDESEEKPVGALGKKNSRYIEEQKELFEKLKKMLKINYEKQSFTSYDVENIKKKFMKDIMPKIKEYFHCRIWAIKDEGKNYHMTVIRRIFKYYGYYLAYSGTNRMINGEKIYGKNIFIVKKNA